MVSEAGDLCWKGFFRWRGRCSDECRSARFRCVLSVQANGGCSASCSARSRGSLSAARDFSATRVLLLLVSYSCFPHPLPPLLLLAPKMTGVWAGTKKKVTQCVTCSRVQKFVNPPPPLIFFFPFQKLLIQLLFFLFIGSISSIGFKEGEHAVFEKFCQLFDIGHL